jgi:hypothetical protein
VEREGGEGGWRGRVEREGGEQIYAEGALGRLRSDPLSSPPLCLGREYRWGNRIQKECLKTPEQIKSPNSGMKTPAQIKSPNSGMKLTNRNNVGCEKKTKHKSVHVSDRAHIFMKRPSVSGSFER